MNVSYISVSQVIYIYDIPWWLVVGSNFARFSNVFFYTSNF